MATLRLLVTIDVPDLDNDDFDTVLSGSFLDALATAITDEIGTATDARGGTYAIDQLVDEAPDDLYLSRVDPLLVDPLYHGHWEVSR